MQLSAQVAGSSLAAAARRGAQPPRVIVLDPTVLVYATGPEHPELSIGEIGGASPRPTRAAGRA
jgi:hypothetical protein